jgi:hypothetical protein
MAYSGFVDKPLVIVFFVDKTLAYFLWQAADKLMTAVIKQLTG